MVRRDDPARTAARLGPPSLNDRLPLDLRPPPATVAAATAPSSPFPSLYPPRDRTVAPPTAPAVAAAAGVCVVATGAEAAPTDAPPPPPPPPALAEVAARPPVADVGALLPPPLWSWPGAAASVAPGMTAPVASHDPSAFFRNSCPPSVVACLPSGSSAGSPGALPRRPTSPDSSAALPLALPLAPAAVPPTPVPASPAPEALPRALPRALLRAVLAPSESTSLT